MNSFKWIAEGPDVFMVSDGLRELFCTMSKGLLTPDSAAEETAAALNDKFKAS